MAANKLINRISFGCARIRDGVERTQSFKILDTAYDLGIRQYDTAPLYGASERILGEKFKDIFDVRLTSKVGLSYKNPSNFEGVKLILKKAVRNTFLPAHEILIGPRWSGRRVVPKGSTGQFSPELIKSQVEKSLEVLKKDSIDTLLLHEPNPSHITPECTQQLNQLILSELINRYGAGTGSSLELINSFGTVSQSLFWGSEKTQISADRLYYFHGFARGLDAKLIEFMRIKLNRFSNRKLIAELIRKDEDWAFVLMTFVLLTSDKFNVVYSTLNRQRLESFVRMVHQIYNVFDKNKNNEEIQSFVWEAAKF